MILQHYYIYILLLRVLIIHIIYEWEAHMYVKETSTKQCTEINSINTLVPGNTIYWRIIVFSLLIVVGVSWTNNCMGVVIKLLQILKDSLSEFYGNLEDVSSVYYTRALCWEMSYVYIAVWMLSWQLPVFKRSTLSMTLSNFPVRNCINVMKRVNGKS